MADSIPTPETTNMLAVIEWAAECGREIARLNFREAGLSEANVALRKRIHEMEIKMADLKRQNVRFRAKKARG